MLEKLDEEIKALSMKNQDLKQRNSHLQLTVKLQGEELISLRQMLLARGNTVAVGELESSKANLRNTGETTSPSWSDQANVVSEVGNSSADPANSSREDAVESYSHSLLLDSPLFQAETIQISGTTNDQDDFQAVIQSLRGPPQF